MLDSTVTCMLLYGARITVMCVLHYVYSVTLLYIQIFPVIMYCYSIPQTKKYVL